MNIKETENLIGKEVIYNGRIREIVGIHLHINKKGITSCRLHLNGIDGYIKIEDAQFFEIIKKTLNT